MAVKAVVSPEVAEVFRTRSVTSPEPLPSVAPGRVSVTARDAVQVAPSLIRRLPVGAVRSRRTSCESPFDCVFPAWSASERIQ